MNKFLIVIVISMLLIVFPLSAFAGITVLVDGTPLDNNSEPISHSGKLIVPMRTIFERLGAQVDYEYGTITARLDQKEIKLTVNQNKCRINNRPDIMPVAPIEYNGKTMIPLRFISQALNADVDYLNEHQLVLITSPSYKNALNSKNDELITKVKKYSNYKNLTMTNEKSIASYNMLKGNLQKSVGEFKKYNKQICDLVLSGNSEALNIANRDFNNIKTLQSNLGDLTNSLDKDTLTNQLSKDLKVYSTLLTYVYGLIVEEKSISNTSKEKMQAALTAEQVVTSDIIDIESKIRNNILTGRNGVN